ncbi:hypothetical protein [Aquimarina sp. 2201CG5-10]|uniref:hypothetical protein n=1 Tax=Aquimarina callyspongiae TaxID=3098150 RepID=UPI002AB518B1|nr:hypothetical protein [Aquimarina sp. 2201CG5-10]MDY8134349.1 hypothetical protein [Aquimarina sp. 2201CG5-10]
MKTREIKEIVEKKGGGCCGSTPDAKEITHTSQTNHTPIVEEKSQITGGCCG